MKYWLLLFSSELRNSTEPRLSDHVVKTAPHGGINANLFTLIK
jgi:hypothetical protein